MYGEQLVTLINAAVDSSKQRKRKLENPYNSQSKRTDFDDKENFPNSELYEVSPMHQSALPQLDHQAFFQAFQDAFMPPSTQQTFPMNFSLPFQQRSTCDQTDTSFDCGVLSVSTPATPRGDSSECEIIERVAGASPPGLPPCDPSHVFDETSGRLCLLNASTKHKVTLGEIQRRLAPPETLHASLINGILRNGVLRHEILAECQGVCGFGPNPAGTPSCWKHPKFRLSFILVIGQPTAVLNEEVPLQYADFALHINQLIVGSHGSPFCRAKSKNGCKALREKLAERGLSLPNGRRKTAPATLFTALCEKEALILAQDFNTICQSTLNTFEIARRVNRNIYSLHEMNAATRVLMGILEAFEEVPQDPADYIEEGIPAAYSINMLSLLTHGFGHNAFKTALKIVIQVVDQQRAIIHGTPPSFVSYSQSTGPRFM